jgi:hypothetical protein
MNILGNTFGYLSNYLEKALFPQLQGGLVDGFRIAGHTPKTLPSWSFGPAPSMTATPMALVRHDLLWWSFQEERGSRESTLGVLEIFWKKDSTDRTSGEPASVLREEESCPTTDCLLDTPCDLIGFILENIVKGVV